MCVMHFNHKQRLEFFFFFFRNEERFPNQNRNSNEQRSNSITCKYSLNPQFFFSNSGLFFFFFIPCGITNKNSNTTRSTIMKMKEEQ